MIFKVFFLLFNFCITAQKITVIAEKTKEPLESVHLTFYKNGKVCYTNLTNENGYFITHFEFDSLETSILGYNSKTVVNDEANDLIIKLSENVLKIDEVVLTNSKKTTIIGDWNIKGKKKDRGFYTKEVYSILIDNNNRDNYKPISLLVNFKEVPKNAIIAFKFYEILKEKRKYFDQIDKEFFYLDIKIPNKDRLIGTIEFELPKSTTGVYEFDLSDLNFELPIEGFFVSPITLNVFDDEGVMIKKPSNELIPKIFSHKTELNNLCEHQILKGADYWSNTHQTLRIHDERHNNGLFTRKIYSPTIALKAETLF
ncbi:MAG: hypothetical protein ACOVLC_11915 [Flavobacterium sp.]